uniref:HTH CENPB-type domain-containing protein n=1 Tax=Laticauda laticaudata TaxID=8630 RepID=A0A8C5WRZ7_LATLA
MKKSTQRKAYHAAFKLKAIDLSVQEGNKAAAHKLGVNESMVRHWKQQHEELIQCQRTTKAFRGHKSRWPELENVLEDWVIIQRADGQAKTIPSEMDIEDFKGGPSWCCRFMRRKYMSITARMTVCQQLPSDYEEKVSNFHKFIEKKTSIVWKQLRYVNKHLQNLSV